MVIDPPFIPKTLVPDAILAPPIEWYGRCSSISTPVEHQFIKTRFPQEGYSEIHMLWKESGCWISCWNGGWKYIEAMRSPRIEFIVHQHPWIETDCLFSDLILPVTSVAEDDIDLLTPGMAEQFSVLYLHKRAIEPIGESKSDLEIVEIVSERLGIKDKVIPWKTHEEAVRTAFELSGVKDYISWDEFVRKQYWVAPVDPNWKKIEPGMRWYWKQPEGKGLKTKSGKIEFYCQWLAEHFPNDPERPPVAHYIPYGEIWQESKFHPRAQKYPFLIISNHPRWRSHAMCDDVTWLREIQTCKIRGPDGYQYEPVWIHPIDAGKRGIKHGDIVMVYNDRGVVLGAAYITERITPGSIYMDHGARLDPISLEPLIDRGGCINLIVPRPGKVERPVGDVVMVVSGYLVDVVKVDLEELKRKYPDAFKRKLHPDVGPCYESWVVG
jgi:trimethylamine-N-oxide reductase (cytochrome c)